MNSGLRAAYGLMAYTMLDARQSSRVQPSSISSSLYRGKLVDELNYLLAVVVVAVVT